MHDLDSTARARRNSVRRTSGRGLGLGAFGIGVLAIVAATSAACSSTPPSLSANKLVQQGLQAQSAGKTTQAVNDFRAAIAKDPTNKFAYYDLGVIYQQGVNQPALAAVNYRKALLADPNYKPALFNLAIIDTPSDPPAAIDLYNQLLRMNPNDANVNFNLGLLLISQNQAVAGHADLKKAIQLNAGLASRVPSGITP